MRSLVLALSILLASCQTSSAPRATLATSQTTAEARGDEALWDPSISVDLSNLTTTRYFATQQVSICPYPEEARANSCGNSVEFLDSGYTRSPGEVVTIVGAAPIDGLWKAIRFMVPGAHPGWADASRLARAPNLAHQREFAAKHPQAWRVRADALELATEATEDDDGERDLVEPAVFLVKRDGETVALELPACFHQGSEVAMYMNFHPCLLYGDCADSAYICDESYCDEVVFLVEPAEELELDDTSYAAFRVLELADRMGVFRKGTDCGFE